MEPFENDRDLFAFIKEHIYVASVCDILDEMGYRQQAMHQRLRPLLPDMKNCGFIGRARTFHWVGMPAIAPADPDDLKIKAMDALKEGDVIVNAANFKRNNASWGGLMSLMSQKKGIAGCVCDGQIRDGMKIIGIGFPVFCAGISPLDSKGREWVLEVDVPVMCGEVRVHPHDLVYSDFDGIVVVPQGVETEVFQRARQKVENENQSRIELLKGKSLREVYDKYESL
jgi:4-hydroxy-4-methyl-2-oxoglutarate aldolase